MVKILIWFKNVRNIGSVIDTFKSLKKLISSKIFNINANDKKTMNVFNNVEVNTLLMYIWYVLNIM